MEVQMRNKTFISSMVGVAAAVAVAGSANAAILPNVVDPFTVTQSLSTTSSGLSKVTITGALFDKRDAVRNNKAGGAGVNGTTNNVGFTLSNPLNSFVGLDYTMSGAATKDLSSIAEVSIVLSDLVLNVPGGTAATGVEISVFLFDSAYNRLYASDTRSTNGTSIFNLASAGRDVGFDLTKVAMLSLLVTQVGGSTSSSYTTTSSSGTLSNFSYTAVPAPGALALLGAAGIVGARRRRA
jgi:hypothetical protein